MLSEREIASWGSGGSNSCHCIASGDSNPNSKLVTGEKEAKIKLGVTAGSATPQASDEEAITVMWGSG